MTGRFVQKYYTEGCSVGLGAGSSDHILNVFFALSKFQPQALINCQLFRLSLVWHNSAYQTHVENGALCEVIMLGNSGPLSDLTTEAYQYSAFASITLHNFKPSQRHLWLAHPVWVKTDVLQAPQHKNYQPSPVIQIISDPKGAGTRDWVMQLQKDT